MPVQQIPILPSNLKPLISTDQVADTFALLPPFGDNLGEYWNVDTATGSRFLFNYKASGVYKAEVAGWRYIGDFQLLFTDDLFIIEDDVDGTKRMNFILDGITTGTLRSQTIQDKNGTLAHLADIPVVASQPETDTGVIDNKYISPLKLKNRRGIEAFFLSAQGSFGTGGGWADNGFIALFPVLLFAQNNTERAVYMFYGLARFKFDTVDPEVAFIIYSTGVPVVTTGDNVRWQLSARYRAEGELNGGGASETILQTQTLTTLTGNTRQSKLVFTLDRTLISDQDVIHLELERIGADGADTYGSDAGVGQAGLILETVDKNP